MKVSIAPFTASTNTTRPTRETTYLANSPSRRNQTFGLTPIIQDPHAGRPCAAGTGRGDGSVVAQLAEPQCEPAGVVSGGGALCSVIPGRSDRTEPRISRFRVRCCASPRNDGRQTQTVTLRCRRKAAASKGDGPALAAGPFILRGLRLRSGASG